MVWPVRDGTQGAARRFRSSCPRSIRVSPALNQGCCNISSMRRGPIPKRLLGSTRISAPIKSPHDGEGGGQRRLGCPCPAPLLPPVVAA